MEKKLGLLLAAGLLMTGSGYLGAETTAAEKKAYENLLKKSWFGSSKDKVRDIRFIAAYMLDQITFMLLNPNDKRIQNNITKLTQTEVRGTQNIQKLAKSITATYRPSQDSQKAFNYAIYDYSRLVYKTVEREYPTEDQIFAAFNKYYTPLVDALMYTYKQQTMLPYKIDRETLNAWRDRMNTREPEYR